MLRRCRHGHASADGVADLMVSSMALHYVQEGVRVGAPGGKLIASMEHPVVSAPHDVRPVDGAWALLDFAAEGPRRRRWLGAEVPRQHRTTATIVGAVLSAGRRLE